MEMDFIELLIIVAVSGLVGLAIGMSIGIGLD